jgi:heterodisulfide reductase subunit A
MGVEKARHLRPLITLEQPMIQAALVVGGGVAGMAAAANLARQGYDTHLVEQGSELGGTLKDLSHLWPDGGEAAALLQQLRDDVQDAGVLVYLNASVDMIGGHIGDFWARLTSGQELRAGAVVLATGAEPYKPSEFGYGEDKRVITNLDLERNPTIVDGDRVTFVGCVGSRADGLGCSRFCCQSMIGQELELRRQGKQVRVAYRDIRTFSRHAEELYEQAMREGVQFFRYDPEKAPRDAISFNGTLTFHDHLLDRDVDLPTDQLVLTVGMVPRDQSIAEQLKVARSEDGFLLERHPKLGPAEAGSPGIFLAGAAQAPKDVRDSLAQGLAAAAKAGLLLARDVIEKEPIVSRIAADPCSGCGLCVRVCPFGAIEMTEPLDGKPRGIAQTIEAACEGCGTCAAACNFDAIEMPYFTDVQIMAQIDAALVEDPGDKVVTFACNWCSYAGADQAGIEKIQYPTSARIIRTMCSGRLSEKFVSHAFQQGAGAVLVTGCRIGDCHYINANHQTLKRFELWKKKFARQGIENRRLQLQWISASQGKEFAAKMREMHAVIQEYSQAGAEGEGACPLAAAAAPGAE